MYYVPMRISILRVLLGRGFYLSSIGIQCWPKVSGKGPFSELGEADCVKKKKKNYFLYKKKIWKHFVFISYTEVKKVRFQIRVYNYIIYEDYIIKDDQKRVSIILPATKCSFLLIILKCFSHGPSVRIAMHRSITLPPFLSHLLVNLRDWKITHIYHKYQRFC